jgi:hypothetical protein
VSDSATARGRRVPAAPLNAARGLILLRFDGIL